MAGTKVQLKVIKADGSAEEYLHTKVIGAISNALAQTGQPDMYMAEQLADVVTYFLYHKQNRRNVTSSEIFSIIKAVLTTTMYEDAAAALSKHQFERKLKRSRVEVVSMDLQELTDAEQLYETEQHNRCRWDKSRIVEDLVKKHDLSRHTARAIATMVEEKIFNMEITLVPASLIKQLVLGDAGSILRAQQQLQAV